MFYATVKILSVVSRRLVRDCGGNMSVKKKLPTSSKQTDQLSCSGMCLEWDSNLGMDQLIDAIRQLYLAKVTCIYLCF